MPDLTLAGVAALVGGAWVIGLWYLGLYTHPAVRTWQRLARLRGLSDRRPWGERLGERLPALRRVQEETDIGRLLIVAGSADTATVWLLRTAFRAGITLAAVLLIDELSILGGQPPLVPPGAGLIAVIGVAVLSYVRLRRQASERQQVLTQSIADSLPHLAMMTFHHRVPTSEALLIFARCLREPALHNLLQGRFQPSDVGVPATHPRKQASRGPRESQISWSGSNELALDLTAPGRPGMQRSTALLYEHLGQEYGVTMFSALGAAVRRVTERGLSSQEVYTALARTTFGARLSRARVAAAQTKTLIVIPMGLMIVPVLVLIGAPLVASLSGIFAH